MNPDDYQIDVDKMTITDSDIDFEELYEEGEQREAYRQQQELAQQEEAAQAKAELDDPRET